MTRRLCLMFAVVGVAIAAVWFFLARPPRRTTPAASGSEPVGQASATAAHPGPVLDRERADRLRALLRDARRAPPATAALPAAPPDPGQMATALHATIPTESTEQREYVRKVVREDYIPLASDCYDAALKKDAKLGGQITLKFAVVGDPKVGGVVDSADFDEEKSTIADETFRTCLRESMLSVAFDAPPGGLLTVDYPIEFAPDGPDGAP